MPALALPPPVIEILPTLQALSSSQKLQIIHALSDNFANTTSLDNLGNADKDDETAQASTVNLAWQVGQGLFGSYHSGDGSLSQNAKRLAKQRIRERHGKDFT